MRVDIISDTHGHLSSELLRELEGADLIVHAGDICSEEDFKQLRSIAPMKACLGNNDFNGQYGPDVVRICSFIWQDLRWQICHYEERLVLGSSDIYVCGHTHRPTIKTVDCDALLINPGSPTYPRSMMGPTMARVYIENGTVTSSEIIQL